MNDQLFLDKGTTDPWSGVLEHSWKILPSASSLFTRNDFYGRGLQTLAKPTSQANEESENHENNLKPDCSSATAPSQTNSNDGSATTFSALSNLKTSPRHDLAMIFTCKVCETRSVKTVCRESYEKGVVVARCGGCNNLHLIADHLGWFGQPGTIEEILAARGEEVKKGSADTYNLTLEDLAGNKTFKE
ncbi:DNL-TYPE ZINC FINGER PROTEIN [Salix koriyanagi]|uniref:DNL-TYPE ZINC FINGER PROTEIN n=1 Tax=Salix koriyanagi TaxID=2511006 RepID=A0A9Q0WLH0_9ROSI|nr:DNL-TYPE ZINC FINGER PROTEIN [Salix koriyanagi]